MLSRPLADDTFAGIIMEILGDEAHHAARVKRVEPGQPLELLDGAGAVAQAEVAQIVKLGKKAGWALHARINTVTRYPQPTPRVVVNTAVPKGPRIESMIDQLSQVGVAAWSPLACARSVVDPRAGKLDRMTRVALEAAKQSGRTWAMEILNGLTFPAAIARGAVIADASGEPYQPTGADDVTLLVGPEGGWTDAELNQARAAGVTIAGFGRHVMRIETAAVVAAGIVLSAEDQLRVKGNP
ncbi:MAG: RsmE family RNA methyltransferase [Planctomycetota bacterium]